MAERNLLQEFLSALNQMGKDALADVGNTYQAVLMQDTGWNYSTLSHDNGISHDPTWERAIEVAKEDDLARQEIDRDNALELGY